ncbi:AlpA family phage regulatory protein [uncultured Ruegeria sp.]|uniref:helix-turn-helix transcriptional regulator n=1 Tax=uncultured Ruegeria sp. TaxID=259304 RepID=UPI003438D8A7
MTTTNETLISDKQGAARYGIHRATWWKWAKNDPEFPKSIKLSARCTRWKLSEVEAWESAKPLGG